MKPLPHVCLLLGIALFTAGTAYGRQLFDLPQVAPPASYDQVHVHPLAHDSLSSAFLIWIKKEVKPHVHRHHTEQVLILEGTATMLLAGQVREVGPGHFITIPENTVHAVRVKGSKPLKVLSIQAPYFDGTDREFVEASF